jgi:capsular polysaccharide biosynthesis protein
MTTDPSIEDYDDEIDLRAIAFTLWKARKAIFIVTLVTTIAAFAVSYWIVPRTYQANAYVFIGQATVGIEQTTGFTITPTLPDLNTVVKLAVAPSLLDNVSKDQAIVSAFGDKEISLSGMVTAIAIGKDQLSLQVTDTDPQRSALLSNTWAEKVIEAVNNTYGLGAAGQALDSQVLQSQQYLDQAQTALEDALSKSQVDTLNAQLQRDQADLKCVLDSASQTSRVLRDLQVLEQGLSSIPAESPISLGDGLAFTSLRQRALTSQPCQFVSQTQTQTQTSIVSVPNAPDFISQIDSASFAGFTVSKALESATQMRTGLQLQLTQLKSDQSRLEQEIPQLKKDLEDAQAQLDQFSLKRDQSKELYNALLREQLQVATVLGESTKVASLSVGAVPPKDAVSRKTLMNTALAGMLGLILSAFGVLAMNWFRNK